jgi:hypothetical protein
MGRLAGKCEPAISAPTKLFSPPSSKLSNFNRAKFRHLLILESATLVTNASCSKQCISPLPKNGTQNAQNNLNFVTKNERSILSGFRNSPYFYSAVISILNA